MSFPRPRFTVRWLMVAVAVVAIILEGGMIAWRLTVFRALYRRNEEGEQKFAKYKLMYENDWRLCMSATQRVEAIKDAEKKIRHFEALKEKYRDAQFHPWLLVPPDPPEPE